MRGQLQSPPGGLAEFSSGPLWMVSSSSRMAREGLDVLAYEGFIVLGTAGPTSVPDLLQQMKGGRDPAASLDGHYALAWAQTERGVLTLLRDPSGAERLYYALTPDLLLFAASVRPLLAHGQIRRRLDPSTAAESVINKLIVFGDSTLWEGIREVSPFQVLKVSNGRLTTHQAWNPSLERPEPPSGDPAKSLRETLLEATERAIGRDGQAAVALSGGIDSAAIAACSVEILGRANVHAFTYEFQDPSHPTEVPYAARFCRKLGIRHHVVPISYGDYLNAVPEAIWRIEHPLIRHGPQAMILSRHMREQGFVKALTGNGVEQMLGVFSHDPYLENLARTLPWVPFPRWTLARYWRAKTTRGTAWRAASRAFPGGLSRSLMFPPREIAYLVLCVLRHNGILPDAYRYYPEELHPLLREISESPRVRDAVEAFRRLSLEDQLRHHHFHFFSTGYSIRPIQKACREAGVQLLSPAYFPHCTVRTQGFHWLTRGDLDAAKSLLRQSMGDRLPQETTFSPRAPRIELSPTVISDSWYRRLVEFLHSQAPQEWEGLNQDLAGRVQALGNHFRENLAPLAVWHRIFVQDPPTNQAPQWAGGLQSRQARDILFT